VTVSLTQDGLKHKEEIVETIFAFISMVQKQGVPDYIGKDLLELSSIYWKFQVNLCFSTLQLSVADVNIPMHND
jgi:secreted Zn-dependent insulinase-like peptidase